MPKKAEALTIPLIEEILKNGLAYLLNVSPLPVHLIFGLAEGLYEGREVGNYWLLGNALLGHGIYGAVAYLIWPHVIVATISSGILHALYNTYIMRKIRS